VSRFVFVSYSHEDRDYVTGLSAYLGENGIDHQLDYGAKWRETIERQIDACAAFVVIMTEQAARSDWVHNEVEHARQRGKPILPLLLSGGVFFGLYHTQYIDVRDRRYPDQRFIEQLKGFASPERSEQSESAKILEAMTQAAVDHKALMFDGRTLVPNRYMVHLSPDDHSRLAPYAATMAQGLAKAQAEFIAERGFAVYGDVVVEIGLGHGALEVIPAIHYDAESTRERSATRSSQVSPMEPSEALIRPFDNGVYVTETTGPVQPVQILTALQREAIMHKKAVAGGRTLVPNSYIVQMSPEDHERLAVYSRVLAQELAAAQAHFIGDQKLTVYGDARVEVERDEDLVLGAFRVIAEVREQRLIEQANQRFSGGSKNPAAWSRKPRP
jgi:hypothetical protein